MPERVLIYEDNDALRKSLEELLMLSDEFVVVSTARDCLSVEEDIRQLNPDVILMDIDMPGMTGIEAVKKIRVFNKKIFVIMLTVFEDNGHVFDAICAGASGYLLKKNVSEKLIPAIREVLTGGAPMSPVIAKMVISSMQKSSGKQYNFTVRENDILKLLCKGMSYKMIANETGLAFETIRSYIKNIYEKLQVHSATEAVSKAINEKLV
ncbi:MAG TPA: response regulator transcription factor [Chitinophagaceae bacterium]|mgnify:CR=1 FL=1|nr:response regulator transcription factor [Chitinophagaceae bacterium]MCB9054259.1 response regulator transcription factor [Chitinophagales bacterium]HPG11895.1 response regulator transcription factor [Chitinophagaceae bacterium]HRX94569.1 response regulator transcription factor [Chitinophagaceae bacterium]